MHDACYYKVKRQYGKWSARASQAVAKCRKAKGQVRKGKEGSNLRKWQRQDWRNTITGRPCGNAKDKREYCRPRGSHPHNERANQRRKQRGLRAKRAT